MCLNEQKVLWSFFLFSAAFQIQVINDCSFVLKPCSLNKKEWICSLFKEWILEKSEIRVNLEWTFVLFTHFGVTTGITKGFRVIPEVTPKWVNNTNVHSKLISLFSKIHSLKSEHIHSFLFIEHAFVISESVAWRLMFQRWSPYPHFGEQGGLNRQAHNLKFGTDPKSCSRARSTRPIGISGNGVWKGNRGVSIEMLVSTAQIRSSRMVIKVHFKT